MLLVTDIGNSSISIGLYDGVLPDESRPVLRMTAKMAADAKKSADEYAVTLHSLLAARGFSERAVDAAVIGSVVPPLTHTLRGALESLLVRPDGRPAPVRLVGEGMRSGIHLSVEDPAALGADIVTNAAAAAWLYGAPVITLDFGTATVISAVNAQKALIGVTIAPGLSASMDGLRTAAARIPGIELKTPPSVLGRSTACAVQAGVVIGTACMADGLIDRIIAEARLPEDTPVAATGGLCPLVLPSCRHRIIHEPELTLLGLYRVYAVTTEREARVKGKTSAV